MEMNWVFVSIALGSILYHLVKMKTALDDLSKMKTALYNTNDVLVDIRTILERIEKNRSQSGPPPSAKS
jgi:hypothetical protein